METHEEKAERLVREYKDALACRDVAKVIALAYQMAYLLTDIFREARKVYVTEAEAVALLKMTGTRREVLTMGWDTGQVYLSDEPCWVDEALNEMRGNN